MNVALLTAGGIGTRMHNEIPKQFINIDDKPLIVYTMEKFQSHPSIDYICVVCLDGWHEILKAYAKQFGITKLKWVVSGGKNGQNRFIMVLWRSHRNVEKMTMLWYMMETVLWYHMTSFLIPFVSAKKKDQQLLQSLVQKQFSVVRMQKIPVQISQFQGKML